MKKDLFRENPAANFISIKPDEQPQEEAKEETPTAAKKQPTADAIPTGYKLNPKYIEKREQRLQLVLQPSLFNQLKTLIEAKKASGEKISVNEYCIRAIEEALKKERK